MIAGALLTGSAFGWPLVLAGGIKSIYDLLLLILFRHREARGARQGGDAGPP